MSDSEKRRLPAEVRKQQIYDSFIDLILEYGYDSISLSTIARRVGISKPAVFQHVGNKEQIFEHLLEEYQTLSAKPIVFDIIDHSAITTLREFFKEFCSGKIGTDRETRLRIALFSRKDITDRLNEISIKGSDLISETILPIVIYGRDSGEIRRDVAPQELANTIWMWIYASTALTDVFPRFHAPSFELCLEMIRAKEVQNDLHE